MPPSDEPTFSPFPEPVPSPDRLGSALYRLKAWLRHVDGLPPDPYRHASLVFGAAAMALPIRAIWLSTASAWSPEAGTAPGLVAVALAMGVAYLVTIYAWARWRLRQPTGRPRSAVAARSALVAFNAALFVFLGSLVVDQDRYSRFGPEDLLHWVEPTPDGTGIVLFSDVKSGIADRFAAVLAATPGARTVWVWSGGGMVDEALRISALIRDRGLDTVAVSHCDSACTIIHAGGRRRTVADDRATLGFHSGRNPLVPLVWMPLGTGAKQVFLDAGYGRAFVDRIESVPTYDLWVPDNDTLLANGAAHALLARRDAIGVRWLLGKDRKIADDFAPDTWKARSLANAPAARETLRSWSVVAWDAARPEIRVLEHRNAYVARIFAAGLSAPGVSAAAVRAAGARLLAGMRAARDRGGPAGEAACARIGMGADLSAAQRALFPDPDVDMKPSDPWMTVLADAFAPLAPGWDAAAAALPPVDDPATWSGPEPAARGACADWIAWYEPAASEGDAGSLRTRFAAVAHGETVPAPSAAPLRASAAAARAD